MEDVLRTGPDRSLFDLPLEEWPTVQLPEIMTGTRKTETFVEPITPLPPDLPLEEWPTMQLPEIMTGTGKTETLVEPITPFPSMNIPVTPAVLQMQKNRKRRTYRVTQEAAMNRRQRRQYWFLVGIWCAANVYFWHWWLTASHIGNPILYALMSVAFLYETTLLPSFYTFYLGNMRRPKQEPGAQEDIPTVVQKVAVISLTVPGSESLEIVRRQLVAMKRIRYPHDSWILVDKEHSPEIEALARSLGVFYFSRHDPRWGKEQVEGWNQPQPPFKAKTKAGNVNSWIDCYGHLYSHFTQLDIDHIPVPAYLDKVLGFFLDPDVKWVQAPSVYGNTETWTARGSAEQELVLQGPLQMGFFGFCRTPFIIGSHCTYDMAAIKQIEGFQPTRAEDHLDTVFLAAQGHEGVFLPEVIATGDGPENFETYIAQQFAWAYSMIQVLFTFTPKCIKNYTPRQSIQFLFVQTWYVFWSTAMLLLFTLPLISLFTNTPIAHASYWRFLLHCLPITVIAFIIWLWSRPWHFPNGLGLSWRSIILHIARWPIVWSALIQVLLHVQKPYMITVKGLQHGAQRPFALRAHYPYFLLIGLSLAACWFYLGIFHHSGAQGYLLFGLQGAAILLLVYATALLKDIADMRHEGMTLAQSLLLRAKPLLLLFGLVALLSGTAFFAFADIHAALLITQ